MGALRKMCLNSKCFSLPLPLGGTVVTVCTGEEPWGPGHGPLPVCISLEEPSTAKVQIKGTSLHGLLLVCKVMVIVNITAVSI